MTRNLSDWMDWLADNWLGLLAIAAVVLLFVVPIILGLRADRPLKDWQLDYWPQDADGQTTSGIISFEEVARHGRYTMYRLARKKNGFDNEDGKQYIVVEIHRPFGTSVVVVPESDL